MYLETHDGFSRPMRVPTTRIVIYDDFGNPIGAFIQGATGEILAEIADETDTSRFHKLLRMLGVNKTVLVEAIKASDIGSPASSGSF